MWSNKNSHSLLTGMQTDTATMEDSLAGSHQAKHLLLCDLAVTVLDTYPN